MRRAVAAAGWVVLVAGCEQPRTELVARVESEVAWGPGRTVQSVVVTVRRDSATGPLRSTRTTALGMGGERRPLPLLVGILPTVDTDTPVWIEALGCGDPNGCTAATAVVTQRAVVRFAVGQTQEVTLLLASACVGVTCGSDERCGEGGRCEPATRATVRPFNGTDAGAVADVARDAGGMDRVMVVDTPMTDAASPVDRPIAMDMPTDNDAGVDVTTVDQNTPADNGPFGDVPADVRSDVSDTQDAVADIITLMDTDVVDVATPSDDGTIVCVLGRTSCAGGCRDLTDDSDHCGACGVSCNGPNTAGRCVSGRCVVERCTNGFADCDANPANGCEADLGSSTANCGRCGGACTASVACVSGVCGGPIVGGIAAGAYHTCAIRSGGRVACWGYNRAHGVLGNGLLTDSAIPVGVSNLIDAVELTASIYHTCARRMGGSIACWGDNTYGQLGNATTTRAMTPTSVNGVADATTLSAGSAHVCARLATGMVSCWGLNSFGQLGDSTAVNSSVPVTVLGLTDAASVSAGSGHTCARRLSGSVVCWGRNTSGELGDGTMTNSSVPVTVVGLMDAVDVYAGGNSTCALRVTGSVVCWGDNTNGQLGNGTVVGSWAPVTVAVLSDVTGLTRNYNQFHICARRSGGGVACWGDNMRGGLGTGTTRASRIPINVLGLTDATEVTAGIYHTCARRRGGAVVCWGGNMMGQLGDGTTSDRTTPTTAIGLP